MFSGLAQPLRLPEVSRDAVTGLQSPPPSLLSTLGWASTCLQRLWQQTASPRLWGGWWHLPPERASADEEMEGTGEAIAISRCGCSNTPFSEGSSEVMFSEGRTQEQCCLPATSHTYRHQMEFRSQRRALQPISQNAVWCSPVGKRGQQLQLQVLVPGSPWQPRCASFAALPPRYGLRRGCTWPEARSGAVSPRWEDNDCAGFYGA